MHLTPEHKTIGKQNFQAAVGSDAYQKFTRRDFIKGAVASGAVAGVTLGGAYFGYASVDRPLRVGMIGCGDEGNVLIGAINPNYLQVVAISDIRPYNIHRTLHGDESSPNAMRVRPGLMRVFDWKSEDQARKNVKVYEDRYEEMLKDPDIEGVIIALPLHLHHDATIKALAAGKHVLTEKLMGHSVAECKEMSRASYHFGRILATGHQRHYSVLYEEAVDLIRMGLLGDIHHIRAQWHRGNLPGRDSWKPMLPDSLRDENGNVIVDAAGRPIEQNVPERIENLKTRISRSSNERERADLERHLRLAELLHLDRDVKAETYGYESTTVGGRYRSAMEELIRWRLWNRTGGGLMAELGSHQLDAASIFISALQEDGKKVQPLNVSAVGGRYIFPEDRDCDDHVCCTYEFPGRGYYDDQGNVADPNKRVAVTYSSINGNGFHGYGEIVMGTQGTMILEREAETMLFRGSDTATSVRVSERGNQAVLDTTESGVPMAASDTSGGGEVSRGYREQMEHWAWCVRNFDEQAYQAKRDNYENHVRCHPSVALADAVIALTSNIAMAPRPDGKPPVTRIDFKPQWFDIDSDETPEGTKPKRFETA